MWWDISKKELKEAETEARLKALEEDKEKRRLKEVGGVDGYDVSFWAFTSYRDYMFCGGPLPRKIAVRDVRGDRTFILDKWAATALRDMLLREFPVEAQAQPAPAKKAGRK